MLVVMLRSFKSVGKSGDLVDVKPGYAKNYLVPFGIAKYATKKELAKIESEKEAFMSEDAKRHEMALKVKEELAKGCLVVVRAAGDDGRLYGSVRTVDVLSLVNERISAVGLNFSIRPSDVDMGSGIKEIGIHPCFIHLHGDLLVSVKLNVARSVADALVNEKLAESNDSAGANAKPVSAVMRNVKSDPQQRDRGGRKRRDSSVVATDGMEAQDLPLDGRAPERAGSHHDVVAEAAADGDISPGSTEALAGPLGAENFDEELLGIDPTASEDSI